MQLHSNQYNNPGQLQPGPVLVVGASHSGGDIALEVARDHPTVLTGKVHGEIPFDIEGRPARVVFRVLLFLANHVLTLRTPIVRKMRPHVRPHGGPFLRIKRADLDAPASIWRLAERTVAVSGGQPVLDGGQSAASCECGVVHRVPPGLFGG